MRDTANRAVEIAFRHQRRSRTGFAAALVECPGEVDRDGGFSDTTLLAADSQRGRIPRYIEFFRLSRLFQLCHTNRFLQPNRLILCQDAHQISSESVRERRREHREWTL